MGHKVLPLNCHAAQSAITRSHIVGGLNSRNLFLTVMKVGKSRVRPLAGLMSGEDGLLGLQGRHLLVVSLHGNRAEKGSKLFCPFL